jgi:hypothetical protein
MAGASNPFIGLTLSQLQTLQTVYLAAVTALATSQSYALNGRQLSRANLPDVTATLGQINAAIADISETSTTTSLVSFTGL